MNSHNAMAPKTLPRTTKLPKFFEYFLPIKTKQIANIHKQRFSTHRRTISVGIGDKTYVMARHVFQIDNVRKKANKFLPALEAGEATTSVVTAAQSSLVATDEPSSRSLSDVAVRSDSEGPVNSASTPILKQEINTNTNSCNYQLDSVGLRRTTLNKRSKSTSLVE